MSRLIEVRPAAGAGGGGAVSSVFTRTGAVVAANGDYAGVVATHLTGAVAATRYVGGTASGAPVAGTFLLGDFVIDQTGLVWICTVAGTPGTWVALVGATATQTLTNKRITKRIVTVNAPGATPSINTDNCDVAAFTGLAAAITSMTTNLSGTPVEPDTLIMWLTDNGTARALTFGASFAATTVALPTTTVISTRLRIVFEWNATISKWDCVGVA